METTKWAKRIAALGTGVLMLGATLSGALAVSDLSTYPTPFVKNGILDDTVIVVGKAAKSEDVLGAVDIAAALQAEAVSKTSVGTGGSTAPSTDKGLKIEKSGNKLNYNDQIYDVQSTALDANDLDMLADATFEDNQGDNKDDEDYTQELSFAQTDKVFEVMYTQPADNDNYEDGRPAGDYVKVVKGQWLYNYTLDFDNTVTVANSADLEGTSIEIQGNTYTITDASVSSGVPTKITLVSGESTLWLAQDQPYTIGEHTITVVDVDSGETKCGVNVDGVTKWVDEDTTETFGELSVGVLDVVAVYTKDYDADTCELTLGSSELVLEDGEPVTVNGVELEGSDVDITSESSKWSGFRVTYKVGEDGGMNQDDIFLAAGEAWTDPVFGNFKVQFEGVTSDRETLKFKASGDDATFTFNNNDGKEVEIPFHRSSGDDVFLGTDSDENLLLPGEPYGADPENQMLLYTTSGGELHILKIDDLTCSASSNKTTIKDLTYGTTLADEVTLTKGCTATQETISLGSLGSIKLNLTTASVYYTHDTSNGAGFPETEFEGKLNFTDNTVRFLEYNDDITPQTVTFNVSYNTDDDAIYLADVKVDGSTPTWVDNDNDDDNTQWAVTSKGSLLKIDQEDDYWLDIMHTEKDAYGNVFVVPMDATITAGGAGSVLADKVNPFTVGLAVLDESAESMSKNLIIVGGPCANTLAAEVMGNPADCAGDFESGKAKIKYFDRKGKAALLVAGYRAEDTRGASYVLADHGKYKLSGSEVEVVVASLSDIKVNKV